MDHPGGHVSIRPTDARTTSPLVRLIQPNATGCTAAFASGIAVAWQVESIGVWAWVVAAVFFLAFRFAFVRLPHRAKDVALLLVILCCGGSWLNLKDRQVPSHHLASMLSEEPVLVRVRGIAASPPIVRDRAVGSMAIFSFEDPATYFRIDVQAIMRDGGRDQSATGQLLVRCDETVSPFRPGDLMEVTGSVRRFPEPSNPGEFNRAAYARVLNQAGMMRVPTRELVHVVKPHSAGIVARLQDWRDRLRRTASAWILADIPPSARTEREALLAALLIGERGAELNELNEAFRRVGLAHLLAISGLHLGVLAGLVLMALRWGGRPRRWHGLVLLLVVVSYVLLIEARLPVLRAAIMTCFASAGLIFARQWRIGGLVALSAMALLVWRPQQLFDAGFQLSYGVVLGLIGFSPHLRARWFGPKNYLPESTGAMLGEWIKDVSAGSVVAWAFATPLVVYHFGIVTPLAAVASIIALPIVAVLLAVGYIKMILSAFLPSAGMVLGSVLIVAADLLVSIVEALDHLPFSTLRVPFPSTLWTLTATTVVALWLVHETRRRRHELMISTLILVAWLLWPVMPFLPRPTLRIDMLSVGDGTCYIVRSRESTVLFDCGSSSDLDAGRGMIIPALQRLNVRSVDAIVISHANLDHFSAVIEVTDYFDVGTVLVSPQFLRVAEAEPLGPAGFLYDELADRLVTMQFVSSGDSRRFGDTEWMWLHPSRNDAFRMVNDSSMVIRIDTGIRRVLLTGDIQREAIALLMTDDADLKADVLELPHHGSFHEPAVEFVDRVDPAVVMQSTGWTRYSRDAWKAALSTRERLITAPDGACWVEIDDRGSVRTGRFRSLDGR